MELHIQATYVDILDQGKVVGRYQYGDPFKPYLHPLNTPAGHTLSLAMPHDHKHHKGLMYGLRTADVNFWEEWSTLPGEIAGIQHHDTFLDTVDSGEFVGFDERLTWAGEDGSLPTFTEKRSIFCRSRPEQGAYEWTWRTSLRAIRNLELILSQWSTKRADGVLVNYHGLGVRLRRDFGCTGGNRLLIDGREMPFDQGMGLQPRETTFFGRIDGKWPSHEAGVTIRQGQANALFVMQKPFAFLALGCSNLSVRRLQKDEELRETYTVTVFDAV